jgi:hypothetical protein
MRDIGFMTEPKVIQEHEETNETYPPSERPEPVEIRPNSSETLGTSQKCVVLASLLCYHRTEL